MKLFYSRVHALRFLKVHAKTLQQAVDRSWIREMRFGPHKEGQFFLRSDLVDFREKYKSGYFEPSAIFGRSQLRRKSRVRGQNADPVNSSQPKPKPMLEVAQESAEEWREYLTENGLSC